MIIQDRDIDRGAFSLGFFQDLNKNVKYEVVGIVILVISALALGKFGSIGGSLAFITKLFAGNWGFLLPILAGIYGLYIIVKRAPLKMNVRFYGIVLFAIILLVYSHLNLYIQLLGKTGSEFNIITTTYDAIVDSRTTEESIDLGGGMIGSLFLYICIYLFDISGTRLVLLGGMLIGLLLMTRLTIGDVFLKIKMSIQSLLQSSIQYLKNMFGVLKKSEDATSDVVDEIASDIGDQENTVEIVRVSPEKTRQTEKKPRQEMQLLTQNGLADDDQQPERGSSATTLDKEEVLKDLESVLAVNDPPLYADQQRNYEYPPLTLLQNRSTARKQDGNITANIRKLEATLESFGVMANVINYSQGPSVTRYELQPAIGVKVSKVLNLTDDLALALAAKDIRMEAPIPGKAAIGIEVPNQEVAVIGLKEVVASEEFKKANSKLTVALGKDLSGSSIVADLAKMPHLLVAGSVTNSNVPNL